METGGATGTNREISHAVLKRTLLTMNNLALLTDPRLPGNPIVWVNDFFCAFTGYERREVLGRNCRFLQGDDRDQPGRHRLRAAVRAAEPCNVVLRNYKKDGTLFYNHLYLSPVVEGGAVVYFVGLQHDATDREHAVRLQRDREVHEAAERERERFGMDLHDGLGQELAGIAFFTGALCQRLAADGSAYAKDVRQLLEYIQSAQGAAWDLARGLSPVDASPHGLGDAIARLCRQVAEIHPEVVSRCDVEAFAFAEGREARYLFRIAQEAVNNAVKHAAASEISVSLHRSEGEVVLEIVDDGVGVPHHVLDADFSLTGSHSAEATAERTRHGMGLYGMRYRAELIGARLAIWPRESGGTVVRCVLPVDEA
ncbi:MAG: ATP-binding protein [Rhodothermales bacterium]